MKPSYLPITDLIEVNDFSDGDPKHVPSGDSFVLSDPELYLRKIATKWMEEDGGGVKAGELRN